MEIAKVLMNPVHQRIYQFFLIHETGTAKELKKALPDVSNTSLRRHIKILADHSILTVVGENRMDGMVQSVYQLNKNALPTEDESGNAVQMPRVRQKLWKKCLIVAMLVIILCIAAAISFLVYISPPKDEVESYNYPPEFFCESAGNRIDYQTDGKCAAYAAAYLLRHFGEAADGEELFPELKRPFGFVSAKSITDVFEQHGYQAKACHGNIDILKQRLAEGHPIIVFIRIPGDTHYAVVVGYDEQCIYLVDSLAENANASDTRYNRVLTTGDFEDVWENGTLLPDNIYIIVKTAK